MIFLFIFVLACFAGRSLIMLFNCSFNARIVTLHWNLPGSLVFYRNYFTLQTSINKAIINLFIIAGFLL
jgi:hypothetical protein